MAYEEGQTATNPATGERIIFQGGQWSPIASSVQQQRRGFIPGTPKAPTQLQVNADTRAAAAEERAQRAEARAQAKFDKEMAGSGPDSGEAVPVGVFSKIDPQVGVFTGYQGSLNTFQDDYGGNVLGGLENTAQALAGDNIGTPGQRDWWANFRRMDNQVRNELFGATLTPSEQASYTATTISPGMAPSEIRRNLESRVKLLKGALSRQREFMIANGYKPQAVDALFAPILQQQVALAQDAEKATEDKAPALGGNEAPPAGQSPAPPSPTGQIPGVGMDNGGGGSMQLAQGPMQQVDDPTLAGVRDEYRARLQRGESAGQLIQWARSVGITNPELLRTIAAQANYRAKNPNVPVGQYDTSELDDKFVPLSAADQMLNKVGQSGVGAGLIAAGDAASGFTLDNMIGMTGGNAERARLGMEAVADQHPGWNLGGTVLGGTLSALALEGATGAAGLTGAARTLGADAAYGAGAGAGGTDYGANGAPASMGDRLYGAGKGTLASLVGSKAGDLVSKGARGVGNASVRAMSDVGAATTLGQLYSQSGRVGAAIKGVEDRVAGLPVVGDLVNARRSEGIVKFNEGAFNKALEPINGAIGDKVGEEAIDAAHEQVSEAFNRALAGKASIPDQAFNQKFSVSLAKAAKLPRLGPEVFDGITEIFKAYDNQPAVTGEIMQQISRELRDLKASYRSDPLARRVGKAIDETEAALFDLVERQHGGTIPEYNAAKQAYRRVSILEDAVLRGKNNGGVFMPSQLGAADKANTIKFDGRRAAASGKGQFHDYQRAGQEVLPSKVPDSGTVGRLVVPAAIAGGAGGADYLSGDGVGLGSGFGVALALAYTKAGQRVLTKGARGANGRVGKAIASEKGRKAISAAGASSAAALTTQ